MNPPTPPTPPAAEDQLDWLRKFMQYIPFNHFLGMEAVALREGFASMRLPFRPEFIGDPLRPALHGGVISTLADTVGGAAAWSTVSHHERVSTIDLRVDYLLPGRPEPLLAEGRVLRAGRRLAVVSMRLFHESNPAQTIADGRGVYNILRTAPKTAAG